MRRILSIAVLAAVGIASVNAAAPATEDEKTLYTLGALIGRNVASFNLTPAELELVKAGLTDASTQKKLLVDPQAYMPKVQALQGARMAASAEVEKKAGDAFITKAASAKGATKTASGLVYTVTKAGTGASPKATDTVKVHYHGTLPDGKVFDSSVDRGEPATFPLNGVIPCWTEALQLMKVGGKSRLICPSSIAYGDHGSPPDIKPGATLVFDVELLNIETK